ncbi:hypothetical protein SK128_000239 [Halocaridina rubra]|uniref:G-protein coupled receptors family 2 profile 2 domain-containing protein n=1 Tax=Halocaridina rubra TaxID=373956 RepID=A0AAN8XMD1_HALRR
MKSKTHILMVLLTFGLTRAGNDPSASLSVNSDDRRISELVQEPPTAIVLAPSHTDDEVEDYYMDHSLQWPLQEHQLVSADANVTVSICCGSDQIFNIGRMECTKGPTKPVITFHYENGDPVEYQFAYNVRAGFPNCSFYNLQPEIEPEDAFYLLPDGSMKMSTKSISRTLPGDQFCILATEDGMEALVCFPDTSPQKAEFDRVVYQTLYPVGLIISAIFLLATLVVYCLVVELRDLLGRCLMCSVSALCIAQISTVVVQMGTHLLSMTACIISAVMMHFWYLSAFFWLNVICFNVFITIWWKSDASYGRVSKWFAMYSAYAWGLALLITSIALARDFSEGFKNSALPKPDFGHARCWFSGDNALIIFFYGPTSVILGINVILFVASACKLCLLNKSSQARVFQFSLYLKLFVLMGITWIFEVISFFVQKHTSDSTSNYVWLVFDLINIMQGMIIFIVFVCRRAVLVRLCEVLCGKTYSLKKFPDYYQNTDADIPNNEVKHSVI